MAIVHKTRTQLVVEAIREKILIGEIKAGEPLRQAALATELNVSRIPVREALLQLEAEGLVNFEPHKGATATLLSAEQVDEIFELRALLEAELLKHSIPNLSKEELDEAGELINEMESLTEAPGNLSSELNYKFHQVLYGKANRPQTAELASTLLQNSLRYVRMHLRLAGGENTAQCQHKQLLQLCREGDSANACLFLKQHILGAKDGIKSWLLQHEANNVS